MDVLEVSGSFFTHEDDSLVLATRQTFVQIMKIAAVMPTT